MIEIVCVVLFPIENVQKSHVAFFTIYSDGGGRSLHRTLCSPCQPLKEKKKEDITLFGFTLDWEIV